MGMSLGDSVRVTLFGESHGAAVGALLEGIPPGVPVDMQSLIEDLQRRRPGRRLLSARAEPDDCEILSGVYEGKTTGYPILLLVRNKDAKSKDYGFLPNQPRPGHADLPEATRTGGAADLRGGGANSGRLTLGLVAAGSNARDALGDIRVHAHCSQIGTIEANFDSDPEGEACTVLNCNDPVAAKQMLELVKSLRKAGDSIGSTVESRIFDLPLGVGEPWFEGLEPAPIEPGALNLLC